MTLDMFSMPPPVGGEQKPLFYTQHTFSQGQMFLAGTNEGLSAIALPGVKADMFFKKLRFGFATYKLVQAGEPFNEPIRQLEAYFYGQLSHFDLPLALAGTNFQIQVWQYLLSVPYGETQTYKQVALAIDSNPRTVGRAIGDNPIPIIVPCHRVIGSNGKLVGYAGGIAMKVWLLQHENAIIV
jgi:methylated-DNA-[protein]-cysteine S-methyltransferase